MFSPQQENKGDAAVKEDKPVKTVSDKAPTAAVVSHTPSVSHSKDSEPAELLTNEIIVDKGKREMRMSAA